MAGWNFWGGLQWGSCNINPPGRLDFIGKLTWFNTWSSNPNFSSNWNNFFRYCIHNFLIKNIANLIDPLLTDFRSANRWYRQWLGNITPSGKGWEEMHPANRTGRISANNLRKQFIWMSLVATDNYPHWWQRRFGPEFDKTQMSHAPPIYQICGANQMVSLWIQSTLLASSFS